MKSSFKEKKPYYLIITRQFIFWLVMALLLLALYLLIFNHTLNKGRILFYIGQFLAMLFVLRIPQFIKQKYNIHIPYTLDFALITFAFCSFILGDVFNFYGRFPIWDSILHTFSGVLIAYVGFIVIDFLDKEYSIPLSVSPMFMSILVVSVALSIGAVWEIGEYLVDDFTGTNNQQYMASTRGTLYNDEDIPLVGHEALKDTMKDLMLDLAGAVAVGVIGYKRIEYIQKKEKNLNK